jgi:light-regulated signal transduction histidine kinase (bacteriophytochrome)
VIEIQPCALLLLVSPDWQLEAVSANVSMLGDVKPSALVGQPLADLIGSKAMHNLRNRMSWLSGEDSEVQDFGVQWGDVLLDIRASRDDDCHLIEAELAVEPRLPDGIGMVRSMTDRLTGRDAAALAQLAMRQLCSLTGFDRLSLCDRRGAIVASFGRQLTATEGDPGEALPRNCADRDAEPVAVLGEAPSSLLERAAFRALSDCERNRLESLGVAASMTFPIRIDGEQVATLHAHHPAARRCGAERRSVAHLFAERVAARMARNGWSF